MSLGRIALEEFAIDPQLGAFGEASPGQRLLFRLLDGLAPRDEEQRRIFREVAGMDWREDLARVPRVVAILAGPDSGKSIAIALTALHRCLFGSLAGLRPGQVGVGLCVAPDMSLTGIVAGYIRGVIDASPVIASEVERMTADSVVFGRGAVFCVKPATVAGRATRGWRYLFAGLDESAFLRGEDYAVNDINIVRSILPRLLPGGQLVGVSTGWTRAGWLFETWRNEFGRSEKALMIVAPTRLMRPDMTDAVIAERTAGDPVLALEYEAQFLDSSAGLFAGIDLEAVIERGVTERAPEEGFRFVAAVDPSGLKRDEFTLTILGSRAGQVVQFAMLGWGVGARVEKIVGEIAEILDRFGLRSVLADQYGGEITASAFRQAGVKVDERPFTSAPGSPKTIGLKGLVQLVREQRITLLDDRVQLEQLRLLEVTRLPGGGERAAAPGRLHDDRATVLALAVHGLGPMLGAGRVGFGFADSRGAVGAADNKSHIDREAECERDRYEDMRDGGDGFLNQEF